MKTIYLSLRLEIGHGDNPNDLQKTQSFHPALVSLPCQPMPSTCRGLWRDFYVLQTAQVTLLGCTFPNFLICFRAPPSLGIRLAGGYSKACCRGVPRA